MATYHEETGYEEYQDQGYAQDDSTITMIAQEDGKGEFFHLCHLYIHSLKLSIRTVITYLNIYYTV